MFEDGSSELTVDGVCDNFAARGDRKCGRRLLATSLVSVVALFAIFFAGVLAGGGTLGSALSAVQLSDEPPLWGGYNRLLGNAKYIDMTHDIVPGMPVWEAFAKPTVAAASAATGIEGLINAKEEFTYKNSGFVATGYSLPTDQLGTQLDPPAHWNEYGATISDVPATVALRPLVVIDVHKKTLADPNYQATAADCKAWEALHGTRIPAGSIVFFRSDWSKLWPKTTTDVPGVSLDALKFLHLERRILFHGHEALDTDNTPKLVGEAWLLHNNFLQAEGVANLDQVAEIGCLVTVGFAKLFHGTGGLARYVAICPGNHPFGHTIAELPGAPLMTQSAPLRRDPKGVMQPTPGAEPVNYCEVGAALGCVNGIPSW
eukprot:TRINITY_DN590_c0_g1_i5.p1 TRINITY_DN590_c0_g1~~TRINITY_DN590_c0_g1_i5.p1  ORF type:complete len:374 (-),score=72.37 TRINITY_DN590_c0_g1_i5:67-1188(-)